MSELTLDHDEWDAFVRHLDGMGVAQLVWREAAPHTTGSAPKAWPELVRTDHDFGVRSHSPPVGPGADELLGGDEALVPDIDAGRLRCA